MLTDKNAKACKRAAETLLSNYSMLLMECKYNEASAPDYLRIVSSEHGLRCIIALCNSLIQTSEVKQ